MGTMARTVAALGAVLMSLDAAEAASGAPARGGAPPQTARRAPMIRSSHDGQTALMVAQYRGLQIRKVGNVARKTITIELRTPGDVVTIHIQGRNVSVRRGRRGIVVDSPQAMASVQGLLGGSPAVFATKAMLSELEATSALKPADMSLLSSAAFVAALVGDLQAPQRLADRFMEKHRGIFRQVRAADEGGCWNDYTAEATAAWNELQSCMQETEDDWFFMGAVRRLGCNLIWMARAESAWFEYLKCLSPLSSIPRLE